MPEVNTPFFQGLTGSLDPKTHQDIQDLLTHEILDDWEQAIDEWRPTGWKVSQNLVYPLSGDDGFVLVQFVTAGPPVLGVILILCQRGNVLLHLVSPQGNDVVRMAEIMFEDVEDLEAFLATPGDAIASLRAKADGSN